MTSRPLDPLLEDELIQAFLRLARGDFSVRITRNYRRDAADTLAYFVNLIAEELARLLAERERGLHALEEAVTELSERFLAFAAGDFTVRAARTFTGDPVDVVAYLFNNTVQEVGDAFAELGRQREVLAAILDSMIDGVLLLDADGVVQSANRAMVRLLGHEEGGLEGRPIAELVAPGERAFAAGLPAEVAREPLRGRETHFRAAGGEVISLAVNGSARRAASGEVIAVVLVARDERELRHAQAQLQMMDRLATMGTVAAGVAHEINNPLAFVLANLEFLQDELDSVAARLDPDWLAEFRRALGDCRDGGERVADIVRELKSYSRTSSQAASRVDIRRLVAAALRMIRNEVRHRARLVTDHRPAPAALGNEGRLVQVIINLVQNAAHAIPEGQVDSNEIRVVTGTGPAGEAMIEVRDTGVGIRPDDLAHIFDPFFTTKRGTGTGLGLAICQQIVAGAGGRVEVETALGAGTTFRVLLPPAGDTDGAIAAPAAPAAARLAVRHRVLVVDDEPAIGESARRLLRDHDVDRATSGSEALALMAGASYDVILCDVHMPEMSGHQLYQRVAADFPHLAGRFIFMTAGDLSSGPREAMHRLQLPVLEKPFDAVALHDAITRLVSPRH
jgi:two-component system, NtrC family, sensor kinase